MSPNAGVSIVAGSDSNVTISCDSQNDNDCQNIRIFAQFRKLLDTSGEDSLNEMNYLLQSNKEKISEPYSSLISTVILVGRQLYNSSNKEFALEDLQITYRTLQSILYKELPN